MSVKYERFWPGTFLLVLQKIWEMYYLRTITLPYFFTDYDHFESIVRPLSSFCMTSFCRGPH